MSAKIPSSRFSVDDIDSLRLDVEHPKNWELRAVHDVIQKAVREDLKTGAPFPPIPFEIGFHEITPIHALALLRRNKPGANRNIMPSVVFKYAAQMQSALWVATCQGIGLDTNGVLVDAQHRLLACVISGTPFPTLFVPNTPAHPQLFAYLDSGRARTPAMNLQTGGYDGVASLIVATLQIARNVQDGVYEPLNARKRRRLTSPEVLALVKDYPNAQMACRSTASDWRNVVQYLGNRKAVVAYFGMIVMDLHGDLMADRFFDEIMDEAPRPDSAIASFRKVAEKDAKAPKPMPPEHMLAALILTFNAWLRGDPLAKRWMPSVIEDFPILDSDARQAEAAE